MRLYRKIVMAVSGLLICASAISQTSSSITGTVRDSSDAVVQNAKVEIFNDDRGIHREVVTNSSGEYLVPNMAEGTYTVRVNVSGFRNYEARNVVLRVASNIRVDVKLKLGQASSEVIVEGSNAGKVETQSSELSTTVDGKQISQLELNGRDFAQLIKLSPGVSDQTGQDAGTVGPGGSVSYAVNGGRTEYNNWEIDGGDVLDSGSMANLNIYPNIDALEQVQVLTSSYDAQYGRSGSGTVEAVTKSGTNHFHGEAFEYLRNQAFNARNYFNPAPDAVGVYRKQDFGYTVGGPIKRDKIFFFWSEEFRKENVPGFYTEALPTQAERAGDFNAVCPAAGTAFARVANSGGQNYPIFPDCPAYSATSDGAAYYGFPNNNLGSYVDTVNSSALLNLVPLPNAPNNYFQMAAPAPTTWREELIKLDDNITDKLHASFRFIHDSYQLKLATSSPWAYSNLPGIPGQEEGPGVSAVFNVAWTANPTLSNEFILGYGANHLTLTNSTSAANFPSQMTMTGLFNNGFGGKVPTFSVGGGSTYGGFTQDAGPLPFRNSNPTYTVKDNITKLLHTHTLKTGFYYTINQKNEDAEVYTQGQLNFNANGNFSYTTGPSTGVSIADMLVGDINTFQQTNVEPKYHFVFDILEPYIQDDWHVTSRLTLNMGLRLSLFGLYKERGGLAYNFDTSKFNAGNMPAVSQDDGSLIFGPGQSITNLSGIVHCGYNGTPIGCMSGHLLNPAPRFGFAYDPTGTGKMAIRGAYGIFYEHTNGNEANAESTEGNPPLVLTPIQFFIQGYTNIGGGEYFPLQPQSIPTKVQWPYMQQFHFDLQQEVAKDTMVTVSYVGTTGTHLTLQSDLNQLHDLPQGMNPFPALQPITDSICNNDAFDDGTPITGDAQFHLDVACGNVNPDAVRQNFPGWSTIDGIGFGAHSSYNALQISGRRTAKDLEITAAYTWSHSIDNSSDRYDSNFVDSYHPEANRASSNFDQRHILNVSYIWNIPFFSATRGLEKAALSGWEWSGITEMQSGEPFSIVNGGFYDNAGVANGEGNGSYADIAPGVDRHHVTQQRYQSGIIGPLLYNPGAFIETRGLTFGNSGRNSMTIPFRTNFDMGLFKQFALPEKTTLQFRAESFNTFNHPQWTGVLSSPSCYLPSGNYEYSAGASGCVNGTTDGSILPSNFMHPSGAHDPRILQFALKLLF